ncbi:ergothioneine biosynthesis protein EgtC [Kitasatospora sp. NPDC056138]|uniref:ergothioneine biosynthesis protein EgtC n=1 Tax=Kitasatospora sp. NPDC056138 TaxID=3345724 RepID=UPI0035D99E75
MCRHLAYLGPPVAIGQLLLDPPASLYRQSWAPRLQQYGSMNADGFGVGWYADHDPVPARYRRAGPVWADPSFADLVRVVRTGALLAAVRSATDGCAAGEAAAAPFGAERWLFSHNGVLPGWPHQLGKLAALLPPEELLNLAAGSDSALLWALTLHRLRAGDPLDAALARTVRETADHCADARLNLLLTDGTSIAATVWGDSLCYRTGPDSVVLASEPHDDLPGWIRPPDRSLLLADRGGVTVRPLG